MKPVINLYSFLAAGIAMLLPLLCGDSARGCTSAVTAPEASARGRGMLWKHRDTSKKDNVVIRTAATDSTMAFVALCNAGPRAAEESWIGFNEAGFAVMNTATYNLEPDTARVKDREGVLMTRALGRCHTVADFDSLLNHILHNERPGVQANFGAIDHTGAGAYFEMSDNRLTVFPLSSSPLLVRSNFSYSGGEAGRLGVARHDAALEYLAPKAEEGTLTPADFTEELSRSFFHSPTGRDLDQPGVRFVPDTGETIPRRSSTASVVIEAAKPGEDPSEATTMWVAIGFPPASYVLPVRLDSIPEGLQPQGPTGHSPLCDEANRLRDKILSRRNRQGRYIFDLDLLRRITPALREKSAQSYRSN